MSAGSDGQVGHLPGLGVVARVKALLDGVLVAAGERREDQLPRVGVARVNRHLGAVLVGLDDPVHALEVEPGVHALAVEVHGHGEDVHVAGALAVAEQRALHAVGAGHHRQFRRGDGAAAVVVGVG